MQGGGAGPGASSLPDKAEIVRRASVILAPLAPCRVTPSTQERRARCLLEQALPATPAPPSVRVPCVLRGPGSPPDQGGEGQTVPPEKILLCPEMWAAGRRGGPFPQSRPPRPGGPGGLRGSWGGGEQAVHCYRGVERSRECRARGSTGASVLGGTMDLLTVSASVRPDFSK